MYDDTLVSVRYSLEDAAMLLDGSKCHVSVEVAALVALELCELADNRPIESACVFVDIMGQINVSPEAEKDELAALLKLWERAAHPKARPALQRARESANTPGEWAAVYEDLLFPIERYEARMSLMGAITKVQTAADVTPEIEVLLSGLDDDVLVQKTRARKPVLLGPAHDEVADYRLGRFDVFGRLAKGGMAEVLLARDPDLLGPCVIKRMLPASQARPLLRQMFTDEARLGLCLSHPNIASVLEYCDDKDSPFIVMEWAYGLTLSRTLRRTSAMGQGLPLGVVLRVGEAICSALTYAYKVKGPSGEPLRVVHRDVSPQNVVLQFDGHIKLLDFGVARSAVQEEGDGDAIRGKFGYMSPEQSLGMPVDDRSDVFCVAICLYEALSGRPLFPRDQRLGVVRTLNVAPVQDITTLRPDVPPTFARLLERMLDLDVDARPTVERVKNALRIMADHRTDGAAFDVANVVQTLEPDWKDWRARLPGGKKKDAKEKAAEEAKAAPEPRKPKKRRKRRVRWLWVMVFVVFCVVCGLLGYALMLPPIPSNPADVM
ncbi:MAG: serine/threonine-protein kinase [Polyangiales bacterium]